MYTEGSESMISFENIGMMYQLEALEENNKFSVRQRDYLIVIGEKIYNLPSGVKHMANSIRNYKSLEKQYIDAYLAYGGNPEQLNKQLRKLEDQSIPFLKEVSNAFQNLKNKMRLK